MAYREPESDQVLISSAQEYVIEHLCRRDLRHDLVPAWERFYRRYDSLIRRYVLSCGVLVHQLDDVAQQCWLTVIRALPSFDCDPLHGTFRAWLFVLVRNTVVDDMRRAVTAGGDFHECIDFDQLLGREPEPCAVFERQWNEIVLQESLHKLRNYVLEQDYLIFVMRRFHEASIAEIAADSGLPPTVVRQRLHRTLEHFKSLITTFGYQELLFSPCD